MITIRTTSIDTLRKCPLKWDMQYNKKVIPNIKNIYQLKGTLTHKMIEVSYLKSLFFNYETFSDVYTDNTFAFDSYFFQLLKGYLSEFPYCLSKEQIDKISEMIVMGNYSEVNDLGIIFFGKIETLYEDVKACYKNFLASYVRGVVNVLTDTENHKVGVEEKVGTSISKHLTVSGTPDLYTVSPKDGTIHLLDYKTGSSIPTKEELYFSYQPVLYSLMIGNKYKFYEKKDTAIFVSYLYLNPNKYGKWKEICWSYSFSDVERLCCNSLNWLKNPEILDFESDYYKRCDLGSYKSMCGTCEYQNQCPAIAGSVDPRQEVSIRAYDS